MFDLVKNESSMLLKKKEKNPVSGNYTVSSWSHCDYGRLWESFYIFVKSKKNIRLEDLVVATCVGYGMICWSCTSNMII